jgi:hypothetical protein
LRHGHARSNHDYVRALAPYVLYMQSPHRRRDPVCTCRPCTAPQHRPTDYSRTAFLFGERASPCSALVVGRHGHSQQSGPADAAMRVCALQQLQVSDSEPLLRRSTPLARINCRSTHGWMGSG